MYQIYFTSLEADSSLQDKKKLFIQTYVSKCITSYLAARSPNLNYLQFYLLDHLNQLDYTTKIYRGHLQHLQWMIELQLFLTLAHKLKMYFRNEIFSVYMNFSPCFVARNRLPKIIKVSLKHPLYSFCWLYIWFLSQKSQNILKLIFFCMQMYKLLFCFYFFFTTSMHRVLFRMICVFVWT